MSEDLLISEVRLTCFPAACIHTSHQRPLTFSFRRTPVMVTVDSNITEQQFIVQMSSTHGIFAYSILINACTPRALRFIPGSYWQKTRSAPETASTGLRREEICPCQETNPGCTARRHYLHWPNRRRFIREKGRNLYYRIRCFWCPCLPLRRRFLRYYMTSHPYLHSRNIYSRHNLPPPPLQRHKSTAKRNGEKKKGEKELSR
jgi:hypothetical protein